MTKHEGDGGGDDYEVGYARPPKDTRFSKGRSGNPDGRRPETADTTSSAVERVLDQQVKATVDGRPSKVSIAEAIVMKLVEKAMQGDPRAVASVLKFEEKRVQKAASKKEASRPEVNFNIIYRLGGVSREILLALQIVRAVSDKEVLLEKWVVEVALKRLGRVLTPDEERHLEQAMNGSQPSR